jgi:hypothetical protein
VSANAMTRCLAETGSVRSVNTETNVTFDRVEVVLGEAECAATQTVHFAASAAFEW